MCFGGGGSSSGNKEPQVYEGRLPAEAGAFDTYTAMFRTMLENQGYEIHPDPNSPDGFTMVRRAPTAEETALKTKENALQDKSWQILQAGMAGKLAPEDMARLDEIYGRENEWAQQNLMSTAKELAGARGLNLSDTPIGGPALREMGNIQKDLASNRAGTELSLKSDEIARAQALREFQTNLNQLRDVTNPMSLMTSVANLGLGLYTPRFRVGTTQVAPGANTMSGVGSILGGLGQLGASTGLGGLIGSGLSGLLGGAAPAAAGALGWGAGGIGASAAAGALGSGLDMGALALPFFL